MNEEPTQIPEGVSPLQFMMANAVGAEYRQCKSLTDARKLEGAVAIMEGDYGGQIYFTCPVRHIRCDDNTLTRLFRDLDALGWDDPSGAGLCFEFLPVGAEVPGGMGGGAVVDGVWLHPRLESQRADVEAVIAGARTHINTK